MKIELFPTRTLLGRRQWRFRIIAKNGEIIASSEGYSRRLDARNTAELLQCHLGESVIVDA